ncbi:hypothetical protein [Burkholderia sp. LMG 21824]|uniref:hypothetical protein n=1 Tax=Burkholderia sp. LMG 21824 TaxID=3158172 RepID=UPI003C2EF070
MAIKVEREPHVRQSDATGSQYMSLAARSQTRLTKRPKQPDRALIVPKALSSNVRLSSGPYLPAHFQLAQPT